MFHKISLLLCLIVFATNAFSTQLVEILVEDGHFPPFKFIGKEGQTTGIYPEIVRKAVSRMPGYTVKFKALPWPRCKKEISRGNAFAMLPPYFHAHDWLTDTLPKRPYIWPYSLPLFTQTDIVVCNEAKLKHPRPNWPEDYLDLSFAQQSGDGIAGAKFNRLAQQNKIDLTLVASNRHTIMMVIAGRVDCTVISKAPLYWIIKEMKKNGEYQKFDRGITLTEAKVISTNDGYLGYTDINAEKNFPYKKDFSIKFDIEIYKMKKNGDIQKIIDSFIGL